MYSDSIHAFEGLKSRSLLVRDRLKELQVRKQVLEERQAQTEALQQRQTNRLSVLTRVLQLYRCLTDAMVVDQVKQLESLISEGLQAVFYDQSISFKAEVGEVANKVSVDLTLTCDGTTGDMLESFGGGPASIVSLLLRTFMLIRLKKFPILLLDETLLAVSGSYVETTGTLLRKLAASSNLPILMVTHNASFLETADQSFEASLVPSADGRRMALKRVKH